MTMTLTPLAAMSRLEAMSEGKCAAHVPAFKGGQLAPDTATLTPYKELDAEFERCQERYRAEGFKEDTPTNGGPQRHKSLRKRLYPVQFSPYRMTRGSNFHRIVQVDRRSAKDDIKAIEKGVRISSNKSTDFDDIGIQDLSTGLVVGSAHTVMEKPGDNHLRFTTTKHSLMVPRDLIGRRVRKAFQVPDKEGHQVYQDFEGTVKKYSIPRQFFKVVYDDGDVEEYDFEELMVIIIGEK